MKHKNTQPLYIFNRENPQNSEPQNGPRSGLDYIALIAGDGMSSVMKAFHNDPLVNQEYSNGPLYPKSEGAAEYATDRNCDHPVPNRISSTFCLGKFWLITFGI